MKKFAVILSLLIFILFNTNTLTAFATHKSFKEGFYNLKDLDIMANTPYSVQNISSNAPILIMIFDTEQRMQQSMRLLPNSPKYSIIPLQYDSKLVVLGEGELVFS